MNTQELNEIISAAQAAADALYEKLALLEERMNETIQRSQEILDADKSISAAELLNAEADRICNAKLKPGPAADFMRTVAHAYRTSSLMLMSVDDQSRIRRFVEVQP
jgi:hypothetical protein